MAGLFAQPALLTLGPVALLALYLLERWRRRPVRVVVADLSLFASTPEVEAEARARRRRLGLQWLLRATAALLLALAAADPQLAGGPARGLVVDLVLPRGIGSGTREPEGVSRLELQRRELRRVLERLRPGDRVRVHPLPGEPSPLGSPQEALGFLERLRPTAAAVEPERTVEFLAARAQAAGGPPVFLADARPPSNAERWGTQLAVACVGRAQPNRGLVSLVRDEEGALCATIAGRDAPGPSTVELVARDARGRLHRATRRVELPRAGSALLRWSVTEGFPADAREVSAQLGERDALPDDDRAFAVLAPARLRRVGLLGDAPPAVLRALRAAPGVELRRLRELPSPEQARALDLLLLPRLAPEGALPDVAVAVVPRGLPEEALQVPGGTLRPAGADPAFAFSLAALAGEASLEIPRLGPPPAGLPSLEPLLRAGREPFAAWQGAGRSLRLVLRAPPPAAWAARESFPLFWGELLELAAPGARGRLEAHTAGEPWSGPGRPTEPLWEAKRVRDAVGELLCGTVAAPLDPRPPDPSRGFPLAALDRLAEPRPPAEHGSLAPLLAGLACLLALAAWGVSRRL